MTWPNESREEVLARVTREHGPEITALVERDWATHVKGEYTPNAHKVARYRRLKQSTRRNR